MTFDAAIIERLNHLDALDWRDLLEAGRSGIQLLKSITSNQDAFSTLVRNSREDPALFSMAEHFDRLDRLVLYDDLSRGLRIRLHIYPDNHRDGPHNHRWPFSALCLKGGYTHCIYPANLRVDEGTDMLSLRPAYVQFVGPGASYTLGPGLFHSVNAVPGTVSLILRGPATDDRLIMTDLSTGRMRWKHGVEEETAEELADRQISPTSYDLLLGQLVASGLIS
jgi:hypothetical protein